jgi:uncharacterized membrane protein YdjX (TVP38/TMEM64 family)
LKPLLFVALLVALGVAALVLPVREWLTPTLDWIAANRGVAWAVYVVAYVAAAVLLVPGSILTLAAGFLFGLPLGVALVSTGSVLGAIMAFLVGRFFTRAWVAERIGHRPRFRALDAATHRNGFVIVLLARLSPLIPYNLLNYAFAITAVRLRDYALATWIGMLPATVLYVYVGTLTSDLASLGAGQIRGFASRTLLIAGFVATAVLTVLITRAASRALNEKLEPRPEDESGR